MAIMFYWYRPFVVSRMDTMVTQILFQSNVQKFHFYRSYRYPVQKGKNWTHSYSYSFRMSEHKNSKQIFCVWFKQCFFGFFLVNENEKGCWKTYAYILRLWKNRWCCIYESTCIYRPCVPSFCDHLKYLLVRLKYNKYIYAMGINNKIHACNWKTFEKNSFTV